MTRLFISYSRQDFAYAEQLYTRLKDAGHDPWLDVKNIEPGVQWQKAIDEAIDTADCFLLLVSPWSLQSRIVQQEWQRAQEKQKRFLLVLIQSIRPKKTTPIPENKPWIDVRAEPLNTADRVLSWLEDPDTAQSGSLPSSVHPLLFLFDRRPAVANITAWWQIVASSVVVGFSLSWLLRLTEAQILSALTSPVVEKLYLAVYMIAASLLLLQIGMGFNGLRTFFRTYPHPTRVLSTNAQHLLIISAATMFFAAAIGIGNSISPVERPFPPFPSVITSYGLSLCPLSVLLVFIASQLSASKVLKCWLPSYPGAAFRWQPPRTRLDDAPLKGRAVELRQPAKVVGILAERRDRAYSRWLGRFLKREGLTVQYQYSSEAEIDAVILILSPWSMNNEDLAHQWRAAQNDAVPVITVLLESTRSPIELQGINWIDTRTSFTRARGHILATLRGEQTEEDPQLEAKAPERQSRANVPAPPNFIVPITGVLLSLLVKMLIIVLLVPPVLWQLVTLSTDTWRAIAAYFVIATVQVLALAAFVGRRFSYGLLLVVETVTALAGLLCLSIFYPELQAMMADFYPDPELLLKLVAVAEFIVLLLLVATPRMRLWAPSGLVLPSRRIAPVFWSLPLIMAWTFGIAMVPAVAQQKQLQSIPLGGGELWHGQPVEARLGADQPEQTWHFSANAEDVVTIQITAITEGLRPSVKLFDGDHRTLGLSYASRSREDRATIRGFELPHDGRYTVEVASQAGATGVYEASLSLYPVDEHTLTYTCGEPLYGNNEISDERPWVRYSFYVEENDIIQANMKPDSDALADVELDDLSLFIHPWIELYGPDGDMILASRDAEYDGIAWIEVTAPETGEYTLLFTSLRETIGPYEYGLFCGDPSYWYQ